MRLAVSVLALLVCATTATAQERGWQLVRDTRGIYSAQLPGKADSYSEKTTAGEAAGHNLELDAGTLYYDVYWTDAAKVPPEKAAQADFLKKRLEESVGSANGNVLSYRTIALGDFVGAEAIIDFPAMGGRLRQRHFVVGKYLVQQTWSGPPGGETAAEVEKFFESLKLRP